MDKEKIDAFKKQYCCSEQRRRNMFHDFTVTIESFEQLLPGKTIKSYASGTRDIEGAFVVFKAVSKTNENDIYYPVFSETVGRKMSKDFGLDMPPKQLIFIENEGRGGGRAGGQHGYHPHRQENNKTMLELIVLARSMMILHVNEPKPMFDPFKKIYNSLLSHPYYNVFKKDMKSINTAIGGFLKKESNIDGFQNIQDYLKYLKMNYPHLHFKKYNFDNLREILQNEEPDIDIYF